MVSLTRAFFTRCGWFGLKSSGVCDVKGFEWLGGGGCWLLTRVVVLVGVLLPLLVGHGLVIVLLVGVIRHFDVCFLMNSWD